MTPPKKEAEAETPEPAVEAKTKKPAATKPSEMSEGLIEFITAIDEYKRVHQRPFPSWGEVYEVLRSLGYERPDEQKSA